MKHLFFVLSLFLIISCAPEANPVILNGSIENNTAEKITLNNRTDDIEINISSEGQFSDTLDIEAGYYTMIVDRERTTVYLKPGDNLTININAKEFDETLSYEGVGAVENNFLAAKYLREEKANFDYKATYSMNEESFLNSIDVIKTDAEKFLSENTELSPSFVELEKKANQYDYLSKVVIYEDYHKYFTKNDEFEASDDLNNLLTEVNYDNEEDFKNFASYRNLVMSHFRSGELEDNIEKIKTVQSPTLKEELLVNMSFAIRPGGENNDALKDLILEHSTDEEFKGDIMTKFEKLALLEKGLPSPEFEYKDVDGNLVSLEDLRGKNVYVDVWATWCGPCKAEIPYLKEWEKELHDENIAFVSISVDKEEDHQKWLDMITDKELGGIQLFSDNDWESDFVQAYAIEGIPRFIMIDDAGNIVSPDAPRPSAKEDLTEMLSSLNIKT